MNIGIWYICWWITQQISCLRLIILINGVFSFNFAYIKKLWKGMHLVYMYIPLPSYPSPITFQGRIWKSERWVTQSSDTTVWKSNIISSRNKTFNWYSHKPENLQATQSQPPTTRFRSRVKWSLYYRLMHVSLIAGWRQNLIASQGSWTVYIRSTLKNLMLV